MNDNMTWTPALRDTIIDAIVDEARAGDDISDEMALSADDYWGGIYDIVSAFPFGPVILTNDDKNNIENGNDEIAVLSPAAIVFTTVQYFIGYFPKS